MMVVAAVCALATTAWAGYYVGQRVGSTPSTWKSRTSRVALGRRAISLLVLITARRVRQRYGYERVLPVAAVFWGLRTTVPLQLLRGGVARLRSYRVV
jgi:hypothetical protein